MSLSLEKYNTIIDGYTARRNHAMQVSQEKYNKFLSEHPEIQEIEDEIREVSLEIAKSTILKKPFDKEAAENKIANLRNKKSELYDIYGVNSNDFEPEFTCEICNDTGFVNGKRCSCLTKRIVEKAYETSHLGDVLKSENFDNFNLEYYSESLREAPNGPSARDLAVAALNLSQNFIEKFDDKYDNILIYGGTGVGKTFLSHSIAKELLDRGKSVVYLTSFKFFDILADNKFHRDDNQTDFGKNEIEKCDLLIIDDLGTEMANSFTITELFAVVNERILAQKPVIISTNLTPAELLKTYSERIYSRIYENYEIINLIGDDIRIQKSMEEM